MSRDATDGVEMYMRLYDSGINLVFLKEPHIDTDVYRNALQQDIPMTGGDVDSILRGVNIYLRRIAVKQIELAFGQAQKEIDDLHQRTREGIETARRNGKRIGTPKGTVLHVKKKHAALAYIKKHSKSFGGELNDSQCAAAAHISRNTLTKYKAEALIIAYRNNGMTYQEIAEKTGKSIRTIKSICTPAAKSDKLERNTTILQLSASGKSTRQIAEELNISDKTVRTVINEARTNDTTTTERFHTNPTTWKHFASPTPFNTSPRHATPPPPPLISPSQKHTHTHTHPLDLYTVKRHTYI